MSRDLVQAYTGYSLTLADGSRFILRPGDAGADRVVRGFAAAAGLGPAAPDEPGREFLAVTDEKIVAPWFPNDHAALPVIYPLVHPTDADRLAFAMTQLTLGIAHAVQRRGGLLLHAALATRPFGAKEMGVLLVAPGATGKSTASRRLPPPWRAVCDDTTLVVRDGQDRYWAHPVPTWSRFYSYTGARGGVWDTQSAFPVHAIFFLSQAEVDGVEALESAACAVALLAESAEQVGHAASRNLSPADQARVPCLQLINVEQLAHAIPAWRLHISLNGAFWNHVERVVVDQASPSVTDSHAIEPNPIRYKPVAPTDRRFVVYTGSSMNPTLVERDVLEILPTAGRLPRVGDVIYFLPPHSGDGVVHRVVAVTPLGIRTRGDHNAGNDSEPVHLDQVVGQVVAAYRGSSRRAIKGAWCGRLEAMRARTVSRLTRLLVPLGRRPYRWLARATAALVPPERRPRVVRFSARGHDHHKILWGNKMIGHYDPLRRHWVIRFPHRLVLDEATLPTPVPPADRNVCLLATNRVTAPSVVAVGDTVP